MSSDDRNNPKITRRDTLKLATAVGALGAGLGAFLEGEDANAGDIKLRDAKLAQANVKLAQIKLDQANVGTLSLKIYDHKTPDEAAVLHSLDIGQFIKLKGLSGEHQYSIKLFYSDIKQQEDTLVLSHDLTVASTSIKFR
jgi:hypothetical protein